jgi:hypothetical protein
LGNATVVLRRAARIEGLDGDAEDVDAARRMASRVKAGV